MNRGVLYAATGEELIQEAQLSAQTVREHMPELPVAIATEQGKDPDGFDEVINLESPSYSFKDKIYAVRRSPFNQTIFFDTDIYIYEAFGELFDMLDRFDIAVAHNPNRDFYTESPFNLPQAFPEYNTGVIAFDTSSTESLFGRWLDIYQDDHLGDQTSFRKALYDADIRIATLPNEYNYLPRYPGHITKDIKIFHGRLMDIETGGAGKGIDIEEAAVRINNSDGRHRLFTNGDYQVGPNLTVFQAVDRSLNRRGVRGTIRTGLKRLWANFQDGSNRSQ